MADSLNETADPRLDGRHSRKRSGLTAAAAASLIQALTQRQLAPTGASPLPILMLLPLMLSAQSLSYALMLAAAAPQANMLVVYVHMQRGLGKGQATHKVTLGKCDCSTHCNTDTI